MLIYTHQNSLLVENAKNTLEQSGISCETKNTSLQSGFGELSGIDTWPEVWILNNRDAVKAKKIIHDLSTVEHDAKQWTCTACNEVNEASFDLCWQCQKIAPVS